AVKRAEAGARAGGAGSELASAHPASLGVGYDMVVSASREPLSGLRMGDVSTFLAVYRQGSLAGAARVLKVTASQVSKAIVRLETLLSTRLLIRSARGVILSEDGQRIAPEFAAMLTRLRGLRVGDAGDNGELTMAAPSYLIEIALPVLATCQEDRIRGIDL